jgi:hypothetical protein
LTQAYLWGNVTDERKQCIKKLKWLEKYQCDVGDKSFSPVLETVQQLITEGDRVLGMLYAKPGCYWARGIRDQTKAGTILYCVCACAYVYVSVCMRVYVCAWVCVCIICACI